jgi:fructose-specific phosphotransferase system IIB component
MKFVAITACPTGVAHTYMAAEQLAKTAKKLGHEIKVETQGAMGIENELTSKDIASADAVIFAVDIMIEKEERFDDIPKIRASVQEAIKNPEPIFTRQAKK